MSVKKLYSNELLASFEYSNIDKDYDFYYVTTSDKYIKGGATFLDIDDINVSALQFESGKSFWVMFPKNAISRAEFVRLLNAKEDGDSLSIKSMTSSSIPEHLLTQLFLNALTSPVDEMISFNNLSGKLLCFRPAWLNKDKKNFIWGMQCLGVKVGDDMCVKLVAHRMTSLALKKQMKFEKRKLQDYPQYEFSYNNNTLKRVSNENKDRRENFIIKPVDGERGSITFFDFTDYETFSCTKLGVLYDILNALHDEFSKYIRVKFKQYSITDSNLNHTGIYLYSKGKIMIHLTFDYQSDEGCTTPGQYLRYHRTFQGLTTRELAEKVGVVPATLVLYENDRHPIKHSTAVALANVLGIDRSRLLDEYTVFVDYPYSSLLKKVRRELSFTQMQMAEVIGIGQTTYSGWEREVRVPRRKEHEKILAAMKKLKVDVDTYLCQPNPL